MSAEFDCLRGKKALVTGCSGFVGSHLVDVLVEEGVTVTGVDINIETPYTNAKAKYVKGDICDKSLMNTLCKGQDIVFHVASIIDLTNMHPYMERVNVQGTNILLEAAESQHVPYFVYTSSVGAVFALDTAGLNKSEAELPYTNNGQYSETKGRAERAVLSKNSSSLKTVSVRPCFFFGARNHLAQQYTTITSVAGSANRPMDFLHVRDVAYGHLYAARGLMVNPVVCSGQAYFITKGKTMSFLEGMEPFAKASNPDYKLVEAPYWIMFMFAVIVEILMTFFHSKIWRKNWAQMNRICLQYFAGSQVWDNSKAIKELGWKSRYSIDDAMKEQLDYYLKHQKP